MINPCFRSAQANILRSRPRGGGGGGKRGPALDEGERGDLRLPSMKKLARSHNSDDATAKHHAQDGHGICFPGTPVCALNWRSYLMHEAT